MFWFFGRLKRRKREGRSSSRTNTGWRQPRNCQVSNNSETSSTRRSPRTWKTTPSRKMSRLVISLPFTYVANTLKSFIHLSALFYYSCALLWYKKPHTIDQIPRKLVSFYFERFPYQTSFFTIWHVAFFNKIKCLIYDELKTPYSCDLLEDMYSYITMLI